MVSKWVNKYVKFVPQQVLGMGCRHSSVDSSAPTILPPRVRVPSTLSMPFSFKVFVLSLSCEKNENKNKKEAGFGPFLQKNKFLADPLNALGEEEFFISPTPTLMAFTWVTNAHGASPQPTEYRPPSLSLATTTGSNQAQGKV